MRRCAKLKYLVAASILPDGNETALMMVVVVPPYNLSAQQLLGHCMNRRASGTSSRDRPRNKQSMCENYRIQEHDGALKRANRTKFMQLATVGYPAVPYKVGMKPQLSINLQS
jgi:hypothetical protein